MLVMLYTQKEINHIINSLRAVNDGVDFVTYNSVTEFIKESTIRNIYPDRVIFMDRFMSNGEEDYIALSEYLREYSNNTELILITREGSAGEALFNRYFYSPMYTPVIVRGQATIDFFKDLISLPMVDVKARYYSLDKKDGSVTSKSSDKIGGFKGGVKNPPKTSDAVSGTGNATESTSKTGTVGSDTGSDKPGFNDTSSSLNGGSLEVSGYVSEKEREENSSFGEFGAASSGMAISSDQNAGDSDEEDDLSLGAFGEQHSDTGSFDEDDEEAVDELETYARGKEQSAEEEARKRIAEAAEKQKKEQEAYEAQQREVQKQQEAARRLAAEQAHAEAERQRALKAEQERAERERKAAEANTQGKQPEQQVDLRDISRSNKVELVTGFIGSGASQYIIDAAMKQAMAGRSIVIVDLSRRHELLSFVNTNKFYASNSRLGSLIHYVEDGVHLLSPGYNNSISAENLAKILSNQVTAKFDRVYVDCPIDSLSVFDGFVLNGFDLTLYTGSDASDMINTTVAFEDRSLVSLNIERAFMKRATVKMDHVYSQDVSIARSILYFANGDWLKNIKVE